MPKSSTGELPYLPHFSNVSESPSTLIGLGILGLAGGGAARLGKSLYDTYTRPGVTSGPKAVPRRRTSGAEMPIEVTEEEAEELRRRGVKVREILSKQAQDVVQGKPSALGGLALGAVGAGTAVGGWTLMDMAVNALRSRAAKSDSNRIRQRIQQLLDDDPYEQDAPLYAQMKTAEEEYVSGNTKVAAVNMRDVGSAASTAWWLLPALAGGGMTIHALGGLRGAMRDSRALEKVKARRNFARQMFQDQPEARLTPVLKRQRQDVRQVMDELRDVREEEEEDKPEVEAVVVRGSGGPSEQASKNTAATQPAAPGASWF